ncbi:MAG TPA: hypothetical protein VGI77_09210, partial [Gaiellaceae bacterium]
MDRDALAAAGAPSTVGGRVRVAHVNANFFAGSGGITLREALALDRGRFESVVVAPGDGGLFAR